MDEQPETLALPAQTNIGAVRQPIVFTKRGEVFAIRQDVAAFFGNNHRNVVQTIDGLVAQEVQCVCLFSADALS